jgi:predicted phage tail protein
MKQVILHGLLQKIACASFEAKVDSFDELISCISANFDNFGKQINKLREKFDGLLIVVDGFIVDNGAVLNQKIRNAKVIELVPVLSLAAFASSTILFTSITATTVAGKIGVFLVNTIIMSVISFGISFLINKLLSPKNPKQVQTSSYIFSSKENAANRNTPIPVSYGRLRIGTHVLSSVGFNFDLSYILNNQPPQILNTGTTSVGLVTASIK